MNQKSPKDLKLILVLTIKLLHTYFWKMLPVGALNWLAQIWLTWAQITQPTSNRLKTRMLVRFWNLILDNYPEQQPPATRFHRDMTLTAFCLCNCPNTSFAVSCIPVLCVVHLLFADFNANIIFQELKWQTRSPISYQLFSNSNFGKSMMTHRCAEIHDEFVKSSGKCTNPNTIRSITEIGMRTIFDSRFKPSHPLIDCKTFPKTNKRKTFDFSQCSSFFETKSQASVTIYPNANKIEKCTLMLITNLAEPEWLHVTCKKKLACNVLCEIQDQNMVPVSSITHRKLLCSLGSITVDAECFRFLVVQ